jgi:glycosyltransferase involved in cell wall biosynthesis
MSHTDLSVIMPTYNNGPEIRAAISSILSQDVIQTGKLGVEIIIINDVSDPKFTQALDQLVSDFAEVKLFHLTDKLGPAGARNFGIRRSVGRYVSFLDADDQWPLNKLSLLLPHLEQENIEVAGGKVQYIFDEGIDELDMQYEDDDNRLTHVHLGTLLLKSSVFEKGLYFDESLTFSEDVDWWLRIRENNIGIVIIEATTLLYHVHGNNMSVKKSIKELQLLEVLHKSLKRRRDGSKQSVPQMKDFRIQQAAPLISIVLPLYNGKSHLKKTLDSVLAQTYTNWELLVVDDGSTDGGAEWIKQNYPIAKIFTQANAGVANARNTGIKMAEGNLVAFLDQDDEWVSSKLQDQWEVLSQNPYVSFATCNQLFVWENGATIPTFFKPETLTEHRSFVPSAILIRKPALMDIGGFDETMEMSSDMDLIRKLRNGGYGEMNIDKLLLLKRYHGNNASMDNKTVMREMLQLLHKQMHSKKITND